MKSLKFYNSVELFISRNYSFESRCIRYQPQEYCWDYDSANDSHGSNNKFCLCCSTKAIKSGQSANDETTVSGKNVKIGNMTLGLRPGVMVMPLPSMSISGNISGIPMFGGMMTQNMNQSGMMMGGTGNQSMTGLGAMMRSGIIPSLCFSMSDAMLFRSMMMHG